VEPSVYLWYWSFSVLLIFTLIYNLNYAFIYLFLDPRLLQATWFFLRWMILPYLQTFRFIPIVQKQKESYNHKNFTSKIQEIFVLGFCNETYTFLQFLIFFDHIYLDCGECYMTNPEPISTCIFEYFTAAVFDKYCIPFLITWDRAVIRSICLCSNNNHCFFWMRILFRD
jgi:hypothetical protein